MGSNATGFSQLRQRLGGSIFFMGDWISIPTARLIDASLTGSFCPCQCQDHAKADSTSAHRRIGLHFRRRPNLSSYDACGSINKNKNLQISNKTDFEKSIPLGSSIEAQNQLQFPNALSKSAEYFLDSPSQCFATNLLILF